MRRGISIALVIHSLDPLWGYLCMVSPRYYTPSGFLSHSLWDLLSPSLSTQLIVRLILSGAFRGRCAVRTLQTVLFKQVLKDFTG